MVIAICDDSREQVEEEYRLCRELGGGKDTIIKFYHGAELLKYRGVIDLVILDIELPDMNGIVLKEKMQRYRKDTLIVFVTNYSEFAMDAFGVNVLGFIEKHRLKTQLPVMLRTAYQMFAKYIFMDDMINSRNIVYIKSEHNYGRLILSDGSTYLIRTSMRELERKLAEYDFLRIHREFLVNMMWIEKMKPDSVQILDDTLPISTRMRGKAKQEYREFCKNNARYC